MTERASSKEFDELEKKLAELFPNADKRKRYLGGTPYICVTGEGGLSLQLCHGKKGDSSYTNIIHINVSPEDLEVLRSYCRELGGLTKFYSQKSL